MLTLAPDFSFEDLDKLLLELEKQDENVSAGVVSQGEAAAYAEVWEWGQLNHTDTPGPKTILGYNPDGDEVWLSVQAPNGYISIHESQYWDILTEELENVNFVGTSKQAVKRELQQAAKHAMTRSSVLISNSAPVDTGALSSSFEVVEDGDQILDESKYDDERTLIIGENS